MNLNDLTVRKAQRDDERAAYYLTPRLCACGAVIGFESARRDAKSCSRPCAVLLQQATLRERDGGRRTHYVARAADPTLPKL